MRPKWKFLILLVVAFLLIGGGAGALIVWLALEPVNDSYAQWDAALALIHYMEIHDDAWPANWEELQESCDSNPKIPAFRDWDDIKARVEIDFTAQPSQLRQATKQEGKPPFKVIWLRNGKTRHWTRAEPNALILQYLTMEKSTSSPVEDHQ